MTIPERALYGFDMAVKQTAVHTTTLKCDKYQPFFGLYTNVKYSSSIEAVTEKGGQQYFVTLFDCTRAILGYNYKYLGTFVYHNGFLSFKNSACTAK